MAITAPHCDFHMGCLDVLGGETQDTKYYHVPSSIYNAEAITAMASTNQHLGMQMHLQKSMHKKDRRRVAGKKK